EADLVEVAGEHHARTGRGALLLADEAAEPVPGEGADALEVALHHRGHVLLVTRRAVGFHQVFQELLGAVHALSSRWRDPARSRCGPRDGRDHEIVANRSTP